MMHSFEELITEAEHAPTEGWDFSWFEGRATEARPSWGYQRVLGEWLARTAGGTSLDLQTGGGEVLAGALAGGPVGVPLGVSGERRPRTMVATESWPPNAAKATRLLHPLGVAVVATPDEPPLPFADGGFDLVTSRHPVRAWWDEIARVLAPGGHYVAQHVGPSSVFEVTEFFLGPQPESTRNSRHPDGEVAELREAGLELVDLRAERLRMEFFDVGAVVHFLRKVVWIVPGFTVDAYRDRLRELDALIRAEGPFVAHSARHLIIAQK
ncbi:class I SAM-dependent methyltransferase [Streptacidiphilus sp. MAP5-3]|uniref:class I SAM-dependent methyltransferase n=1 Tax=unclassified Streptacidiphilus TaxID=2643834 RepID=UPI0035131ABB